MLEVDDHKLLLLTKLLKQGKVYPTIVLFSAL